MSKRGNRRDRAIERIIGKGLDQVAVGSKLLRLTGKFLFAAAADDDHRRRVGAIRGVDFGQQFHPADVRHFHVAEDGRELLFLQNLNRLLSITGLDDIDRITLQGADDPLPCTE